MSIKRLAQDNIDIIYKKAKFISKIDDTNDFKHELKKGSEKDSEKNENTKKHVITRSMKKNTKDKDILLDSKSLSRELHNLIIGDKKHKKIDKNKEEKENKDNDNEIQISDDEEEYDSDTEYESITEIKKDKQAHEMLQVIKKELKKSQPNLVQILKEPLILNDRIKLVELYKVYENMEENTEEWLELKSRINTMFNEFKLNYNHYNSFTVEEQEKLEEKLINTNKDSQISYKYKILSLNTSESNRDVILKKYNEFIELKTRDEEYGKLKNWLNYSLEIPHDNIKELPNNANIQYILQCISKRLDEELYGMKNVKEQLLYFLNSKLQNPKMKRCNLGLIGPPGVGKTMISRTLAEVMNFPFEQISFGGMQNADYIKGSDISYIGGHPGEIVRCLKRMKCKNGIIFLDEYEKISENKDLCASLLHITDPSQNKDFKDNYLSEITIDLSHLWFIYSMNEMPQDSALCDRIFTINVSGYSFTDKIKIIQTFLIPRALDNLNLPSNSLTINDETCKHLINRVCKPGDKGVRTIEKSIFDIANKILFAVDNMNITMFNDNKIIESIKNQKNKNKNNDLKFPIEITNDIIDKCIERHDFDRILNTMYI